MRIIGWLSLVARASDQEVIAETGCYEDPPEMKAGVDEVFIALVVPVWCHYDT